MNAAKEVLELELGTYVPVCGLIKDERHNTSELIYGDPPEVIELGRRSNEFYLVQRIQDEVHRFAITFHIYALRLDRKSTRLNSSHVAISYAVFCLNNLTK